VWNLFSYEIQSELLGKWDTTQVYTMLIQVSIFYLNPFDEVLKLVDYFQSVNKRP